MAGCENVQKVRQNWIFRGEIQKSAKSETKIEFGGRYKKVQKMRQNEGLEMRCENVRKVRQNSGFMIGVQKCAESDTK